MDSFRGKMMHSQQYKHYEGLEDKHVVVVGIGNSALDCAVELTRCSKSVTYTSLSALYTNLSVKVTMSTRRGAWLWRRVGEGGVPYDVALLSRKFKWVLKWVPTRVWNIN